MQDTDKYIPALVIKSHVFRDEAEVEYVRRAFQLCALKFLINMRGSVDRIASYNRIIISGMHQPHT